MKLLRPHVDSLVAITCAVAAGASAAWAHRGLPFEPLGPDGLLWLRAGGSWLAQDWTDVAATGRPRFYLFLSGLLDPVGVGVAGAQALVSVAAWALTTGLVAWVVARVLRPGPRAALAAVVAAWLYTSCLPTSVVAWYTNSQALLSAVFAAHLAVAISGPLVPARVATLGALVGLALVTKEQAVFLVAADLVAFVILCRADPRRLAWVLPLFACSAAILPATDGWFFASEIHALATLSGKVGEPWQELRSILAAPDWRAAAVHGGSWPEVVARGQSTGPGPGGLLAASAALLVARLATTGPLALIATVAPIVLATRRDPRAAPAAWIALHLAPLVGALVMPVYNTYHLTFAAMPAAAGAALALAVATERRPVWVLPTLAVVAGAILAPGAWLPWRVSQAAVPIALGIDFEATNMWIDQRGIRVVSASASYARVMAARGVAVSVADTPEAAARLGTWWLVEDQAGGALYRRLERGEAVAAGAEGSAWRRAWSSPSTESGRRVLVAQLEGARGPRTPHSQPEAPAAP